MRLLFALVALSLSGCASNHHAISLPPLISAAPTTPIPTAEAPLVHQADDRFTLLPPCGPGVPSPCRLRADDVPPPRLFEARPDPYYQRALPHCAYAGSAPCWLPDDPQHRIPSARPAMYAMPRALEPGYAEPRQPVRKALRAPETATPAKPKSPANSPPADAKPTMDDVAIIAALIRISRSSYRGPCGCPDDTDRAGKSCGRRSAHDRPGGAVVHCASGDITPAMIASYRAGRK